MALERSQSQDTLQSEKDALAQHTEDYGIKLEALQIRNKELDLLVMNLRDECQQLEVALHMRTKIGLGSARTAAIYSPLLDVGVCRLVASIVRPAEDGRRASAG